jgi:hypothetical protein
MSTSIDLYIYETDNLILKLKEWGASDDALLLSILQSCGSFVGKSYVLLCNEYYEEFNPYYNVMSLLESAFGLDNAYRAFQSAKERSGISSVDKWKVASKYDFEIMDN